MLKKQKKMWLIAVAMVIIILLLVPYKYEVIDENGTVAHYALLYTQIKWVHAESYSRIEGNRLHKGGSVWHDEKLYFFPENLKKTVELQKEYWDSYEEE